jgi:uncharacterized membrane protein YphA (DoxX/SURF4 family)
MRIAEIEMSENLAPGKNGKGLSVALWALQWLLAILFVFSGVMKFLTPVAQMTQQSSFSGTFFHFIGLCEILGGVGLVLPALIRILPVLTPIAACGLTIIMVGATIVIGPNWFAALPLFIGVMAAFVAYGRFRLRSVPARVRS